MNSPTIPFHEWKQQLVNILIKNKGIKKKKARKMAGEYEEEYNLGDTPEIVIAEIFPS